MTRLDARNLRQGRRLLQAARQQLAGEPAHPMPIDAMHRMTRSTASPPGVIDGIEAAQRREDTARSADERDQRFSVERSARDQHHGARLRARACTSEQRVREVRPRAAPPRHSRRASTPLANAVQSWFADIAAAVANTIGRSDAYFTAWNEPNVGAFKLQQATAQTSVPAVSSAGAYLAASSSPERLAS